eukprot:UN06710
MINKKFPADLFIIVEEYRGEDTLEIIVGKQKTLGSQVKKILSQGGNSIVSYMQRRPEDFVFSFNNNPLIYLAESLFLDFYVCLNGEVVFLQYNGEKCKTSANEIWRGVCQNIHSEQQSRKLKLWKNFLNNIGSKQCINNHLVEWGKDRVKFRRYRCNR